MTKGHDKGHKGQMSDRDVMRIALEALIDFGSHIENCPQFPTWAEPKKHPSCTCGYDTAITALRQSLEQPEQVNVPEGWKLVPIEPTDAMLSVPVNIDLRECVTPGGVTGLDAVGLFNAWEAMIEAAPQPWDTTDMACRPGGMSIDQEPVAFVCRGKFSTIEHCEECKPLYAAPPKREWVELTGDEVNDLKHWLDHRAQWSYIEFARAIEAKLKEKNA